MGENSAQQAIVGRPMTEAEWLACKDPTPMLDFLKEESRNRKLRLFVVACCHHVGLRPEQLSKYSYDCYQNAILTAELFADGKATDDELGQAADGARKGPFDYSRSGELERDPFQLVAVHDNFIQEFAPTIVRDLQRTFFEFISLNPEDGEYPKAEQQAAYERVAQSELLRDTFGNPFRPVAFSPDWRTDTVVALASQMYESRTFAAMPILADALQDAGCEDADVLSHCRDPKQVHVRGCWVVDLVLGKE